MGKGLLWGSAELLLLPGESVDHGAAVSQRLSVPLLPLGLRTRVGRLQPQGLEAPSLPDLRAPAHPLSVEGKGLETVCEALWAPHLGPCPDTAVSTGVHLVPSWGHMMDTRVRIVLLSFRVLFCFSFPCLEITRASLGWMSPPRPEVKPSNPQPMEGRGLGCTLPRASRSALPVPDLTKDE